MDITDDMLQAAVRKAIEAGLLPRNACREDANDSKELMRLIVQAALAADPQNSFRNSNPSLDRHDARRPPLNTRDVKRAIPAYAYS